MGVRTVVTRLLPGEVEIVVECRRCGTNVSPDPTDCPTCGGTEFSRYEIPQ